MGRLFGTDGVRGIANKDLDGKLAYELARAAGFIIKRKKGAKPTFLLGRDTRISGNMLESAMAAGLCAAGADVVLLGVLPTPAVAYLVRQMSADAGIMLTASHNPYEYNGIKIFNEKGFKLYDEEEEEIEAIVLDGSEEVQAAAPAEIGLVRQGDMLVQRYIDHIRSTIDAPLMPLRVVIDCSNGSASRTAGEIFSGLGAQITLQSFQPDGINVNRNCGSMHVETLARFVKENGFDVGLAFDGDADRCLAVDSTGDVVDGDQLIALFAKEKKAQGRLPGNTMVGTILSNLGFFRFGEENGIHVEATKVGDRYVLEKMRERGYALGGEQSGHIIFLEYMTTGDGQLSGLQLLSVMSATGRPLCELKNAMTKYPQVAINVEAAQEQKLRLPAAKPVWDAVEHYTKELGESGRVLVRPSGTEPLVRVMVEGRQKEEIERIAQSIAQTIRETL